MAAGDVYRALWRHKFFILVLTAAFVAATWYGTTGQARVYESSTLLRVQESANAAGGNGFAALQASQLLAQTYAQVINAGGLNGRIQQVAAAGRAPGSTAHVHVSADPVKDLDLLLITVRSRNPTQTMLIANAVPPALRSFIADSGTTGVDIVTIDRANGPGAPTSRHLALNLALAITLGLIFNGALALLLELFRDRLPEAEEFGQEFGHPVLATIPSLRLHRTASVEASREAPASFGVRRESRGPTKARDEA